MTGCLFCRISKKEIPSEVVYEDKDTIVFKDINPQAPVHLLVVPKEHVASVMDLSSISIVSIFTAVREVALQQKVGKTGFRLIANHGPDGGQEIEHVHFHLLGGRRLGRLVEKVD